MEFCPGRCDAAGFRRQLGGQIGIGGKRSLEQDLAVPGGHTGRRRVVEGDARGHLQQGSQRRLPIGAALHPRDVPAGVVRYRSNPAFLHRHSHQERHDGLGHGVGGIMVGVGPAVLIALHQDIVVLQDQESHDRKMREIGVERPRRPPETVGDRGLLRRSPPRRRRRGPLHPMSGEDLIEVGVRSDGVAGLGPGVPIAHGIVLLRAEQGGLRPGVLKTRLPRQSGQGAGRKQGPDRGPPRKEFHIRTDSPVAAARLTASTISTAFMPSSAETSMGFPWEIASARSWTWRAKAWRMYFDG